MTGSGAHEGITMAGANESNTELPALGFVCAGFESSDLIYFQYWDRLHGTIERRWGIILGYSKGYWAWDMWWDHNPLSPKYRVLWLKQTIGIDTIIDSPWSAEFDYDSLQGKWSQIVVRPSISDRMNLRKKHDDNVQNEL